MDVGKVLEEVIEEIKDLLNLTPSEVIGIDIGFSSIKMAEIKVQGKGTYKLQNYASVPLIEGCFIEDEIQRPEDVKEAIKEALVLLKSSRKSVCIGLSGPNCLARKLQLAADEEEDLEDQVYWEAEQYLPFPIENSKISFHLLGKNDGGGMEIVLAATKEETLLNFKDLVDECGVKTKIIDLSLLALSNIFEITIGEQKYSEGPSTIFIDMGAQKTLFLIYGKGSILFTKEIPIGGLAVTEEIQRRMGVNFIEAEDLKILGDDEGNLPEEVLEIIEDMLGTFCSEIKNSLDFYITSTSDESFTECYVTGGASRTPGLYEKLDETLELDIISFNPLDAISVNTGKLAEDDLDKILYEGAVALGLALREYNK